MRIVVAEDSVLFRESLARVLVEQGHDVVATVGDAEALVSAVESERPDLAIVDVRMPPDLDSDGARAAAGLRAMYPEVGILLLSQHIELKHVLPLIGTPGFGYLLRDRVLDLTEFADSLHRVATGGTSLDPEVVQALVKSRSTPSALDDLSGRERRVLGLVSQGHSNTSVAKQLSLSERTVEARMRSVFTKLGLHDDGSTHRRALAVVKYLEAR